MTDWPHPLMKIPLYSPFIKKEDEGSKGIPPIPYVEESSC
jgi:hypothetical protein